MANPFDQFDAPAAQPPARRRYDTPDSAPYIKAAADELGIDPVDLATVISYETGGTFDPDQRGPTTKWGQHRGLIQFGEPQRAKYGVRDGMTLAEQMPAVVSYLRDAGVRPGHGIMDVYSAINAGGVGRYNASDTAAGGAPGTVADKVNFQMADHRRKAGNILAGMLGINTANAGENPARGSNPFDQFDVATPAPPAAGTPQPVGEMRAYEPGILDSLSNAFQTLIGNRDGSVGRPLIARAEDAGGQLVDAILPDALQRGWERGKRDLGRTLPSVPTVYGPEADQFRQDVMDASGQKRVERYGPSLEDDETMRRMSGAQSLGDWAGAVADNPSVIGDVVLESMGQQAIPLLGTAVAPAIGVPLQGASSFNTERLAALDEAMQQAGVDLTDPEAVAAFRANNPDLIAAAEERGTTRGAVIAPIDMLTAGMAGRVFRGTGLGQAAARTVTDATIGSGGGMAGEAGAQLATDGKISSLGDVLTEGVAEGPTAVIEGVSNVASARRAREGGGAAPAAGANPFDQFDPPAADAPRSDAIPIDNTGLEPAAAAQPAPAADPGDLPRLIDDEGRPIQSAILEFRKQHGADAARAVQVAQMNGEPITLAQALEQQERMRADRKAEVDRQNSDEGMAAEQQRLRDKADAEAGERKTHFDGSTGGSLQDGEYETETGLRYRVVTGRLNNGKVRQSILQVMPDGDERPIGAIDDGVPDQASVGWASGLRDGYLRATTPQAAAVSAEAASTPEAPAAAPSPGAVAPEPVPAPPQAAASPAPAEAPVVPAEPASPVAATQPEPSATPAVAAPQTAPVSAPETPVAPRTRFTSPDDVAAQDFVQRAVAEGVPEETARKLATPAPRDEVTGYYDGRTAGVKASTVERAQEHVRSTGESAFYVDGDIVNLGGLNKAAKDDMNVANRHFRAMSDILRTELEAVGADVVPLRTGGDELGVVVVNAGEGAVRAAMQAADAKIRAYAAQNGLDTIPHTKQGRTDVGVGLHLGMAPIVPDVPVSDIFSRASIEVNQSKETGNVARTTTEGAGAGASGQRPAEAAGSAGPEGAGAGQPAVAAADRAPPAAAARDAGPAAEVAPLLERADDRPDISDGRQNTPTSGQSTPEREAGDVAGGSARPVENQRGRGDSPEFRAASFTNRRSWAQDAYRAAGLDPDAAELLPVGKQFEAVARALKDKFGITAKMGDKALGRMAVDQVLDLYRNAQTMAHVLGLPEKAVGLGDSLTLLLRGNAPYLGAMYPGGGKIDGVDLPAGAIALPRRSNSFAHEWGHALDLHLTSKYGFPADGKLLTKRIRAEGIDFQPNTSQEAFVRLLDNLFYDAAELAAKVMALQQAVDSGTPAQQAKAKAQLERLARGNSRLRLEGTKYLIDSKAFGRDVGGKGGADYFGDPAEMLARAFEAYTAARVEAVGGDVSALAKGDSAYLSNDDDRFARTFPKLEERLRIFAAFDDLFSQLAKEQLIAQGVAAANPGNLDSFDPRVWLQDAPPRASAGVMGAIREQAAEINAWRERSAREARRPQDPMSRTKRLQNALMAWVTPIQGVFRVMERRYPQSKAMRTLANKLVTAPGKDRVVGRVLEQAIRITGGRNFNQFGNIIERYQLDKLGEQDRLTLRRLLVSAESPDNVKPEMAKAAAELRRFMDTLWYDNQEADINLGYTKNGYLPRVIDMAAVQADAAGFIEAAAEAYKVQLQQQEGVDAETLDQQAEALARAWHANIVSAPPINFNSSSPTENYSKHRSLPAEADTILERFYVNDPLELIHQYIGRSARATEFAKAFGPKGEQLNELFRQMSSEGVLLEDQRYMQGAVSSLLGRQSPGWMDGKPRAQAMLNQVNAYGVMSMLGRVLISSIAEPGMAGLRTGSAANVFKPYYNLFKQMIGTADAKAWREITRAIGLVGDAQADAVVQARLGGTFESTPKTDARLARYFAITGLHGLTNAQRVAIMPVAHRYLLTMAEDAAAGGKAADFARAELAELGVKDVGAFGNWIRDADGARPSIGDLFDANGRETEQGAVYMTAMSRLNEQIIQAPYRFDRPEAANSPGGRFLYGIMSFNLAFWNNVYKRQANVIAREYGKGGVSGAANVAAYAAGNLAPPMIAYFMTQLLVTIAREALLNPQRWEEWDKDDTLNENLFMLTLSRAFPMGLFDIPIQAYQGLKYQRDLTGVAVGAVPSYFLGSAQKIINAFTDANSPKTNNAEFSAMQGGYQLVANPLIAHVATSLPGGPFLSPLAGIGVAVGTSAAARDAVATAVVGEKDSLVAKRKAAERREQKALQSDVRNGDRQSERGTTR